MSLQERRSHLAALIHELQDEQLILILEQELTFQTHHSGADVTDTLSPDELRELKSLAADEDTGQFISHENFSKQMTEWRSRL